MKLYVTPASPRARKTLAVAHHLQLPFEQIYVDLLKGDQKKPEFLKLNPNGRIPVLVDGDFVLWESNAIIQYLADQKPGELLPTDARGRADVARWLFWDIANWDSAAATLLYENLVKQLLGAGDPDPVKVKEGEERFRQYAAILDQHLADREWVLGSQLTIADFALAAPLSYAERCGFPVAGFANIANWYGRIEQLDGWQKSAPPPVGQ